MIICSRCRTGQGRFTISGFGGCLNTRLILTRRLGVYSGPSFIVGHAGGTGVTHDFRGLNIQMFGPSPLATLTGSGRTYCRFVRDGNVRVVPIGRATTPIIRGPTGNGNNRNIHLVGDKRFGVGPNFICRGPTSSLKHSLHI